MCYWLINYFFLDVFPHFVHMNTVELSFQNIMYLCLQNNFTIDLLNKNGKTMKKIAINQDIKIFSIIF